MIIWIASYPKSGNTWIRSLINQILFIDPSNKEKILSSLQKNISAYPKINHFKNLNSTFNKDEDFQKINNIIKNWKTSQNKINTDKNLKFLKTHNILTSINLEGQTYDLCFLGFRVPNLFVFSRVSDTNVVSLLDVLSPFLYFSAVTFARTKKRRP